MMEDNAAKRNRQIKREKQVKACPTRIEKVPRTKTSDFIQYTLVQLLRKGRYKYIVIIFNYCYFRKRIFCKHNIISSYIQMYFTLIIDGTERYVTLCFDKSLLQNGICNIISEIILLYVKIYCNCRNYHNKRKLREIN